MPDTLPPPAWGSAPFDDRDLDAVLAGETADVPVTLRPVADALAALRAAPAPAELRGEANAMADFRALRLNHTGRLAGVAPTLLLPAVPAGQPRRRPARYRGRRRGHRPLSPRAGALTLVALAAASVVVALLTGSLPGPIERLAGVARSPAASAASAHPAGNSSPKTETTSAAMETSPQSSVAVPATSGQAQASSACRAYYGYDTQPFAPSAWSTRTSQWQQLTRLAGSRDPRKVYRYCVQYLARSNTQDRGGSPGQQSGYGGHSPG